MCNLDGVDTPCGVVGAVGLGGGLIGLPLDPISAGGLVIMGVAYTVAQDLTGGLDIVVNGNEVGSEYALTMDPADSGGQNNGASSGGHPGEAQCMSANIAAVNHVSNLNVASSNVTDAFWRNGAWNYDFSISGASLGSLPAQRYALSVFAAITGIGSSLHVPGPGSADPSVYGLTGGVFSFTTHIDSAYATWHTPIGAFLHWFIDYRDKGAHRKPC